MQGGLASLGIIAHNLAPALIGKDPLDHAVLLDTLPSAMLRERDRHNPPSGRGQIDPIPTQQGNANFRQESRREIRTVGKQLRNHDTKLFEQ